MRKFCFFLISLWLTLQSFGQQYEPEWLGEVVVLKIDTDTLAMPADKSIPKIKTSYSLGAILFDIGNERRKYVVKGPRATTQLEACDSCTLSLIVKYKDNDSDPTSFIQLVKFEEKKKDRRAEIAKVNWVGELSEDNMNYVKYQAKRYGSSSYILTFPAKEGEYGVKLRNPDNEDEKVDLFYCFGLHSPVQ